MYWKTRSECSAPQKSFESGVSGMGRLGYMKQQYVAGGLTAHLSRCTQRHQLMVRGRRAHGSPLLVHPEAPTLGTGQEGLRITSPGAPRGTNSWYGARGSTDHLSWCTQRHRLLVRGKEGIQINSPGAPRGTNSWYGAGGHTDHLSCCTQRHQLLVWGKRAYGSPLLVHLEAPTLGTGQGGLRITSPGVPRGINHLYGAGGPRVGHKTT